MIHPTAIISKKAQIDSNVEIGPYSVIGDHVSIGHETCIGSHVVIDGHTTIGQSNRIFGGAILGMEPQDKNFDKKNSYLEIGDHNIIREHVTIHAGWHDERKTVIGNHNYLMASSHIGHDTVVKNHTVIANASLISGHVEVGDYAFLSGAVAVHQFVRIGNYAMVGGLSRVTYDVAPFSLCEGSPSTVSGVNVVALKRASFSEERISAIKDIFRILFFSKALFTDALKKAKAKAKDNITNDISLLIDFVESSKRGLIRRR